MLKKFSFFACFLCENAEVLSGETVFHSIGPCVSPDRTFSKTNAPILKRHRACVPVQIFIPGHQMTANRIAATLEKILTKNRHAV